MYIHRNNYMLETLIDLTVPGSVYKIQLEHKLCEHLTDHRAPELFLTNLKTELESLTWLSHKTYTVYRHYYGDFVGEYWLTKNPSEKGSSSQELYYRQHALKQHLVTLHGREYSVKQICLDI